MFIEAIYLRCDLVKTPINLISEKLKLLLLKQLDDMPPNLVKTPIDINSEPPNFVKTSIDLNPERRNFVKTPIDLNSERRNFVETLIDFNSERREFVIDFFPKRPKLSLKLLFND
ncbi:MAG: hypothetical protein ACXW18_05250 [Pyrinomonadaceae bacterium]